MYVNYGGYPLNRNSLPRVNTPRAIVVHHVGAFTLGRVIDLMAQRGLSTHYVVESGGSVLPCVSLDRVARHMPSGRRWGQIEDMNGDSIGIKVINCPGLDSPQYTEAQYLAVYELIARNSDRYVISPWNVIGNEHCRTCVKKLGPEWQWERALRPDLPYALADLTPEGVTAYQSLLCWRRADPGPIDGILGPRTKAAWRLAGGPWEYMLGHEGCIPRGRT